MFTPPAEVPFTNMNTNTISSVLCISDVPVCCLIVNSWGETVHAHSTVSKGSKTFQYTFFIWTHSFQILCDYPIFRTAASGCSCFVMSLCMPNVCIVSSCTFACNSACTFVYT